MTTEKLNEIAEIVRAYFLKTRDHEYTDVGDVWEVLDQIHQISCGSSLEEWLAEPD